MIRQSAFEPTGNKMLKGGLHCHTTRSDGRCTPEETIALHAQNGYDFLALTDHRQYNYVNYAPQYGVLIVPGMEVDAGLPGSPVHCFHSVSIGPSREDGNGFEQDQKFESLRVTRAEEFQPLLDRLHENNNLTVYCHPGWSFTPSCEFEALKGNFAMELWNSGCVIENDLDSDNGMLWDELLVKGQRIFGVATDDGHKKDHHCKGWVRVNAKRDLNDILRALKEGAFYASTGPEIFDFYIDDEGKAVVKCSPVAKILFHYCYLPSPKFVADGETMTEASYKVPDYCSYIRASVVDENGMRAWTNPIFLK